MNKKMIFLSLLAMTTIDVVAQRISAKNEVIDCGNVTYESPVTVKFELTNKGSEMNIDQVRVSCGCTTVDYPHSTIRRGDSFTVSATYDARQLGHFEKEVAIFCDASDKPFYLKMRGVVVASNTEFHGNFPFKVGSVMTDRNDVEFDNVNRGDCPVQLIHVKNTTSHSISPVMMHLPSYLTANVSPANIAPGKTGVVTLKLDSKKLRKFGITSSSMFLGTKPGDKVSADKEISVSAVLLPDFDNMSETQRLNAPVIRLSTDALDLGEFGDKSTKNGIVTIENVGRTALDIRSVQMFTVGMNVKLNKLKINPGEQAKMKISVNKKQLKNARSKPRVLIISNDPISPKVVVEVRVK